MKRVREAVCLLERYIEGDAAGDELGAVRDGLCRAASSADDERYSAEAKAQFCSHPAYSAACAAAGAVGAVAVAWAACDERAADLRRRLPSRFHSRPSVIPAFECAQNAARNEAASLFPLRSVNTLSPWGDDPAWLEEMTRLNEINREAEKLAAEGEATAQARLFRDLVGSPFRPPTLGPRWLAGCAAGARRWPRSPASWA